MNIASYRQKAGLSQAGFARLFAEAGAPASQGLISQWESGLALIPAERCVQIERITRGSVTRIDLRPDLFGPPAANDPEGPSAGAAEEG